MKKGDDGFIDITLERGLKDRAQRTLLDIELALESGEMELIEPLEKRASQKIDACKAEYLSLPEKVKSMLFTVYEIDVNISFLDDVICQVLTNLSKSNGEAMRKEFEKELKSL
jgi:hypothetical protein